MLINLDQLEREFSDWDLKLQIDGRDYATRAVEKSDLDAMLRAGQSGNDAEGVAALRGLFVEPPPDMDKWDRDRTSAVVTSILAYRRARAEAFNEAAGRRVTDQYKSQATARK